MIVHNFDPVLIDLGLFQIRWYSMAYILGIVLGWIYAKKIIKKTEQSEYDFFIESVLSELFCVFLIILNAYAHPRIIPRM